MGGSTRSLPLLIVLAATGSAAFRPALHIGGAIQASARLPFFAAHAGWNRRAGRQRPTSLGVARLRADSEEPGGRRRLFIRAVRLGLLSASWAAERREAAAVQIGRRVMLRQAPDSVGAPDVGFPGPMQGQWRVTCAHRN